MKKLFTMLFVLMMFTGCALTQDTTEVVSKALDVYQQATELQEKLEPHVENQVAMKALDDILIETKLLIVGEINSERVQSIYDEAKVVAPPLREEAVAKWETIPTEIQDELKTFDDNLLNLKDTVDNYLENNASAVETGQAIVDFVYYAYKIGTIYAKVNE